jgi:hypothetical protein
MKSFISSQELEALGDGLSRDYIEKTNTRNSLCFDIEGFITDYLGLTILYETFAEKDSTKIGFLANGVAPLLVIRNKVPTPIVFPKDTIVIEKSLLRDKESSRRRFTLAHKAAHKIIEQHAYAQAAPCFHSSFEKEADYSQEDLKRIFSWNETFANRLGASILMPPCLIAKALEKYNNAGLIPIYNGEILAQKEKMIIQKMADGLGVSFPALYIRLRQLDLFDNRPIDEYVRENLHFGGALC